MRLKKLKLAGFKSFVDPTTLYFPSNIVGIVGPNGCGKSNLIDAIRWVTGESSAKYMRTESMAEVIFNGSVDRKPASQASVEMVFDNAAGTLGGEYGHFSEIAIKRIVDQEGQSAYYLNGARCRRKDITDIFLGTGLGPRSYAIIEQGTISRFIEAKPEDIRVFLEEAAGISKYKERRRETENRIQQTRENLNRIEDIRQELAKQLERLQRQAKAAERYKALREEERRYQLELQALRWQSFQEQLSTQEQLITKQETHVATHLSQLTELDQQYQHCQEALHHANGNFQEAQQRFYQAGSESARLEESMHHEQQRQTHLQKEIVRVEQELTTAQQSLDHDKQKTIEITRLVEELQPKVDATHTQLQQYQEALTTEENSRIAWQQEWDKFNAEFSTINQAVQVDQTRLQHLETQLAAIERRIQQLEAEQQQCNLPIFDTQLHDLNDSIQQLAEKKLALEQSLKTLTEKMMAQKEICTELEGQIEQKKRLQQELKTQHVGLDALQKAALGQGDGALTAWLKQHELNNRPKLVEHLEVEAGWEKAVETVLDHYLQAICVDNVNEMLPLLAQFSQGKLSVVATVASQLSYNQTVAMAHVPTLISKVTCPWPAISFLLHNIYTVEDVAAAVALLPSLQANESIITRCGLWLNQYWMRVMRLPQQNSTDLTVIERQKKLKQLVKQLADTQTELEDLQKTLQTQQTVFAELQQCHKEEQFVLQNLTIKFTEITTQLKAKQEQQSQVQQRLEVLQKELIEQQALFLTVKEEREQTDMHYAESKQQIERFNQEKIILQQRRDQSETEYKRISQSLREQQENKHQLTLRLETSKTQQDNLTANMQRTQDQIMQLTLRTTELSEALAATKEPLAAMDIQHQTLIAQCTVLEQEKQQAQQQVLTIEKQLKQLEDSRQQQHTQIRTVEAELEHIRLEAQSVRVKASTIEEAVLATGALMVDIIGSLATDANLAQWQTKVDELAKKIQQLGAVNLAAVAEYDTEKERKDHLDAQATDLLTALDMLEDAIRKIDLESKQLFQETFNKINEGFGQLFPRLFGGGKAELVLAEENWLKAGVIVMARPPGKRNSSIHMLSGGEKALTALALVFAIFQLNPAPFCMLDEVDAPLDEANVGRFCQMIQEMSQVLQFIIVTHNKTTMELAHQLTGVTMSEPGVSRIVAVDVAEAISLAEVAV